LEEDGDVESESEASESAALDVEVGFAFTGEVPAAAVTGKARLEI